MKTITLTAPSAWASALINDDYSGLSPEDCGALNTFLAREGVAGCLDCKDAGFHWRHDASPEMPLGTDCQEYIFPYPEENR